MEVHATLSQPRNQLELGEVKDSPPHRIRECEQPIVLAGPTRPAELPLLVGPQKVELLQVVLKGLLYHPFAEQVVRRVAGVAGIVSGLQQVKPVGVKEAIIEGDPARSGFQKVQPQPPL